MGKTEVQRWDPPNSVMPKLPFPAWGATSKYIKANDLAGPIFPVERKNDAATMIQTMDAPKENTAMSYPVFKIEHNKHVYTGDTRQEDCVKIAPLLIGPSYSKGDGKNGYVPVTPMHERIPLIAGPVFEGVESACTFRPMVSPKVEPEVQMSGPMFPVEHGSKYTTQIFGCSGSGLKVEKQKVLAGPGNRDTGDRNAALIDSKNKYVPEVSKKVAPLTMTFPKLPLEETAHSYGPVPTRVAPAEARMEMPGPVYPGVEGKNEYLDVPTRVHGVPLFIGPKLPGVESKNCYQEVPERVQLTPLLTGPCLNNVEHDNHYVPESKRVDGEPIIIGPVFNLDGTGTSKYNLQMQTERAPIEGTRLMTAPIFPGIVAQNTYGPVEPPLAPTEKITSVVPMSKPKYPNIEAKNKYNLQELDNGFPEKAPSGGEHLMTAPKYPGVEEAHKYGPVTERKETHKELCVPCYTEDPTNKYSHIPEKQYGLLEQPTPLYRGVESKNVYSPTEGSLKGAPEKMQGQHVMAGPVYEGVGHECKYVPESTRVEGQLAMCGPVFHLDGTGTSKYNEMPERAPIDGTRLMTAPIFPGIKAENSYATCWEKNDYEPLKKAE
jgi:hypothetical protein